MPPLDTYLSGSNKLLAEVGHTNHCQACEYTKHQYREDHCAWKLADGSECDLGQIRMCIISSTWVVSNNAQPCISYVKRAEMAKK
jgi:hypothetical protein